MIQIPVSGYSGTTIPVKVKHGGTSAFVTTGLTNNPNATCSNGVSSSPSDQASLTGGVATIYTCAASTFVTYTPAPVVSSASSGGGGGSSYTPVATTTAAVITQSPSVVTTVFNTGSMSFIVDHKAFKKSKTITFASTLKNGTKIAIYRIGPNNRQIKVATTRVIKGKIQYKIPMKGKYIFSKL